MCISLKDDYSSNKISRSKPSYCLVTPTILFLVSVQTKDANTECNIPIVIKLVW